MRFSQALRHEVVSTVTASRVTHLEGFVVAGEPPRVTAMRVKDMGGGRTLVDWADLSAFGTDAVTVDTTERIHAPRDETEGAWMEGVGDVLGKRVLDERGDSRGTITDVEFDPASGAIALLITDREEIPGQLLLGAGSYAVIVAVERSPAPSVP